MDATIRQRAEQVMEEIMTNLADSQALVQRMRAVLERLDDEAETNGVPDDEDDAA